MSVGIAGWVAVLAAAVAAWWAVGPSTGHARLAPPPAERAGRPGRRSVRSGGLPGGVGAWVGGAVAATLAACLAGGAVAGVLVCAVACPAVTVAVLVGRHRARNRRRRARAEVARAAETMASLLRSGRVPTVALAEAARDIDVLRTAAATSAAGGDVAGALRRAADAPGHEGLTHLAESWQVATRAGASLSGAWERAAAALAMHQEVERIVVAEVAAARAGGRIMAALPVVGLALGYVLGGDSLGFLVGTPPGWACLLGGIALGCAGVLWSDRLADAAAGG